VNEQKLGDEDEIHQIQPAGMRTFHR